MAFPPAINPLDADLAGRPYPFYREFLDVVLFHFVLSGRLGLSTFGRAPQFTQRYHQYSSSEMCSGVRAPPHLRQGSLSNWTLI